MEKKNKTIALTIMALIGLVAITAGMTYAIFNYAKTGTTDNSVTTGSITFLYTEISGIGKGITLTDSFPMTDSQGKAQTGEGKVFDFKVEGNTGDNTISYEVTARKKADSLLDESVVNLYLTKVSGMNEEQVLLNSYSNLNNTTVVVPNGVVEKTLYKDSIPSNTNYSQDFRLRMWLDENTDFSSGEMNGKSFSVTVNVYATGAVVSDGEISK